VLAWLRDQPVLSTLAVCVFSSSASRDDVERAYALGANAFIVKPPSLGERLEVARFLKQWLKCIRPPLAATEGLSAAQSAHARRSYHMRPDGLAP
jgi:CheY-like chemotaxis protein